MNNFNEYFEKQGSIYLNDIKYQLLSLQITPKNIKTELKDSLDVKISDEKDKLNVIFTREITHTPNELFNLVVSFGCIYTFKKEYIGKDELDNINFKSMLEENKNILFLNIIARTSQLISEITSSHGQPPLITPPIYIKQKP